MVSALSWSEARDAVGALHDAYNKGFSGEPAFEMAAVSLGISLKTLHQRLTFARDVFKFIIPDDPDPQPTVADTADIEPPEPAKPGDNQDLRFLRTKVRDLQAEVDQQAKIIEELSGMGYVPNVAEWAIDTSVNKKRSVVNLVLSDIHMGEVINPAEINHFNAYNPEIAERRLRRLFEAATDVGTRWQSDCEPTGCILYLLGDNISGDIHYELAKSNALQNFDACQRAADIIASGIRLLLLAFGRVHIVSVVGNHGRITVKPTAKLAAKLNYDSLVATLVRHSYRDNDNVTFQIEEGPDALIPVFGRRVLATHGDKMGSRGGQGFLGPMATIIRGAKRIEQQMASVNQPVDLIVHGHFHTSGNASGVFSNGSIPGYSEFGHETRFKWEPPQQWLFLLHEKWWVRERAEIKLEDPAPPTPMFQPLPAAMTL